MQFKSNNQKGLMADINVTPFVDVMLVLLVIFMITTPLMLNGIKLDLPKTKEVNNINLTTTQTILSLTRSKEYYIGKNKIIFSEILDEIKKQFAINKTNQLFLRADFEIPYGDVAQLMSFLKRGGITKIALVTEIDKQYTQAGSLFK